MQLFMTLILMYVLFFYCTASFNKLFLSIDLNSLMSYLLSHLYRIICGPVEYEEKNELSKTCM